MPVIYAYTIYTLFIASLYLHVKYYIFIYYHIWDMIYGTLG